MHPEAARRRVEEFRHRAEELSQQQRRWRLQHRRLKEVLPVQKATEARRIVRCTRLAEQ